ncbi:MAG: tRNA epoxyqueuosine(34) reductase QueG [Magnetococcales bacterium]|nr:tRNA epoxyqueuosine(34) reductase QueG [Magnetococcales bacterium]
MSKSTNPWHERKEALRRRALTMGFAAAGFAPSRPPPHAADLGPWLAAGCHGEMNWMAREPERRADPRSVMEGDGIVLVLGYNLAPGSQDAAPDQGVIASYARHADYHDFLKKKSRELITWLEWELGHPVWHRIFVDSGPVLEKPLAVAAGLGWQGKNSLLVSRRFGCRLMLAEIFLALPMTPDPMEEDHCGTCNRCVRACPTQALERPYRLNASRCLATFSVEARGAIPREFRQAMGMRIFGCDLCLSTCPWNRFAPKTREPVVVSSQREPERSLAAWAALDGGGFQAIFRHTPLKRLGLTRFLRNVATALGNWRHPDALPPLERLLRNDSPLVRQHAVWALGNLAQWAINETGSQFNSIEIVQEIIALLDTIDPLEQDPTVRAEIVWACDQARQLPAEEKRAAREEESP